jgi:hypothetical protein
MLLPIQGKGRGEKKAAKPERSAGRADTVYAQGSGGILREVFFGE